jgi:translation initiation factor IF-3
MDYGKFKYEAAQKVREARKNQINTVLKTVRFGLKIDDHDFGTKLSQVRKFLQAGDKVRVMVVFRGREQSRPEMGVKLLQRLSEEVVEFGTVESTPSIDGRNMVMVIAPLKNKADARAEARREAQRATKTAAEN